MADKYTYADVIIDPNDPRVEIGAEYFFGKNPGEAISNANADDVAHLAGLEDSDNARFNPFFIDDYYYPCIIRKKEPEKKYVPFDLSNPEVRKGLRGKWIKADGDEAQISGFHKLGGKEWMASITTGYVTNTTLLKRWTFEDGSPCGKEVE